MSCRILHLGGYNPCCLQTFKSPANVQIQTLNEENQKSIRQKQVHKQTCRDFNAVSVLADIMSASKVFVCLFVGGLTRVTWSRRILQRKLGTTILVQHKTTRFP